MKNNSLYDYIENIEPLQLFYYISIIASMLFVFQFFKINLSHISAIIVAIIMILYLDKKNKRSDETKMDNLYLKLHMINPRPSYFYIDSDVIELIDDIKEYKKYNIIAYSNLIYSLDNFLEIVHDMELGVKDFKDNIDIAVHQKKIAIEYLQSFLFKLPVDRALEYKLERAIYYLSLILQRHIDKMVHMLQNNIKKHGYNKKTGIYYLDHPKTLENNKIQKYINIK